MGTVFAGCSGSSRVKDIFSHGTGVSPKDTPLRSEERRNKTLKSDHIAVGRSVVWNLRS